MKTILDDQRRVRVIRNPVHFIESRRYDQPWLVLCELCPSDGGLGFFSLFRRPGRTLGWTPTWSLAMEYARQHAADHEVSRCPTCKCIPEMALPVRSLP